MTDTLLAISVFGVPLYSARGLTQTLDSESSGKTQSTSSAIRRTVNGLLVNLSPPQMQKYSSVISCDDQRAPAIDGVWAGLVVVVDCVPELSYITSGGSPARPVVPGSSRTEGAYTFYRPRLTMMVISHNQSHDEYGAVVSWQLTLEEL